MIGRSQTWVYQALAADKALPAEHVLAVEAATGISKHDLRPDIYPLVERRTLRPDQSAGADLEPAR